MPKKFVSAYAVDEAVTKALFERATKFGDIPRYNNIKAWPFWLPFIPYPYLNTDAVNPLGMLGVAVAAGGVTDIPIIGQQDATYQIISVKYTAYMQALQTRGFNWSTPAPNYQIKPSQVAHVRPHYHFLEVTIIVSSIKGSYILGGTEYDPMSGLIERPIIVRALQGVDDGYGQLETPMQIPREATIKIRVRNTSAQIIFVNGVIFGYKVAV
jgi:hypothetical protein